MTEKTDCYECRFFKMTGFFDNKASCFGGTRDAAHVFIIGEISHINDVGCQTYTPVRT
jgi:hypothetical protein